MLALIGSLLGEADSNRYNAGSSARKDCPTRQVTNDKSTSLSGSTDLGEDRSAFVANHKTTIFYVSSDAGHTERHSSFLCVVSLELCWADIQPGANGDCLIGRARPNTAWDNPVCRTDVGLRGIRLDKGAENRG